MRGVFSSLSQHKHHKSLGKYQIGSFTINLLKSIFASLKFLKFNCIDHIYCPGGCGGRMLAAPLPCVKSKTGVGVGGRGRWER